MKAFYERGLIKENLLVKRVFNSCMESPAAGSFEETG